MASQNEIFIFQTSQKINQKNKVLLTSFREIHTFEIFESENI